jgi:hypothetical protein
MSYQIAFARDGIIVGYLGREGMDGDVLRDNKKEAVDMFDLKACSKRAQEFRKVCLPTNLKNADPRELLMFHVCVDRFELEEGQIVAKFADKYEIKVISAATGGAVETYQYEPR